GLERPLRDSRAARAGRRLGVRGARLHVAWTAVARATPARARLAADDDPAERLRLHARLGRPPRDRRPCPPDDRLRPLPVLRYDANPVAAGAREQPEGRQLARRRLHADLYVLFHRPVRRRGVPVGARPARVPALLPAD